MPCLRRPLRADRLREGLFPLRGPLRPNRRLSRFWTLLRDLTGRPLTGRLLTGPLREGPGSLTGPSQRRTTKRLTGRHGKGRSLRGWVPSQRRTTFHYSRKAYGKLRGGILPELGGNFRLCAVDQKRSFFPRVGPFLDLLSAL